MKKILLIEDVISRQKGFMNERNFTLEEYDKVLENAIGEQYHEIALAVKNNSFNFDKYSIVMAHKSAFENNVGVIINRLKEYCKKKDKPLIFFSGGVQNYYDNTYNEYLELETKFFYSDNLKLFLDAYKHEKINILMLSYGEKWVLNTMLNILEKINLFLNTNNDEDIVYDVFKNFTEVNKLNNIDFDFYDMQIEDGWVYQEEIIKLRDEMVTHIKSLSHE